MKTEDEHYGKLTEDYYENFNKISKSIEIKGDNKKGLLQMDEVTSEITMSKNINTNIVCINEDKLELILNEFCKNVEKKREFVTPLSLIITIIATLTTATFSDRILEAEVWEALFWMFLIVCVICLIKSIYHAAKTYKQTSVKDVLKKICGGRE